MSKAKEKYINMYKSELFRASTEVHVCETYIKELEQENKEMQEALIELLKISLIDSRKIPIPHIKIIEKMAGKSIDEVLKDE